MRFNVCTKFAHDAHKGKDFERARRYLLKARDIRKNDAAVESRLAGEYERTGEGERAIELYGFAAASSNAAELRDSFRSEAPRVRNEGPREWRRRPIY